MFTTCSWAAVSIRPALATYTTCLGQLINQGPDLFALDFQGRLVDRQARTDLPDLLDLNQVIGL
jgi:hypothetical protein